MEMTLCLDERFCKCGSELMIEYAGETSADSAVTQMFDELHHGPDCGPVSPQMAAVARSKMTRRELLHRRNRENRVTDEHLPREHYDMLFPDSTRIRAKTIAGALTALEVPRGTQVRARDVWVEAIDGGAQLRLLCQLGGYNRGAYAAGVAVLQSLPGYISDFDETFNPAYASFCFKLPDTIDEETREQIAAQAEPPRDLAAMAAAAKDEFAAMGSNA